MLSPSSYSNYDEMPISPMGASHNLPLPIPSVLTTPQLTTPAAWPTPAS